MWNDISFVKLGLLSIKSKVLENLNRFAHNCVVDFCKLFSITKVAKKEVLKILFMLTINVLQVTVIFNLIVFSAGPTIINI